MLQPLRQPKTETQTPKNCFLMDTNYLTVKFQLYWCEMVCDTQYMASIKYGKHWLLDQTKETLGKFSPILHPNNRTLFLIWIFTSSFNHSPMFAFQRCVLENTLWFSQFSRKSLKFPKPLLRKIITTENWRANEEFFFLSSDFN